MIRYTASAITFLWLLLRVLSPISAQGNVENYMPYDPSNTQSNVSLDLTSHYFSGGHRFYSMLFSYHYAIPNNRHMMSLSVPVVHTIFNDDFAGFENTTGIGDLRFSYMGVPYISKNNVLALKRVAAYLDVSAPTGSVRLGRGVGAWVYKPGIIVTYQPEVNWYLFPQINFQFSPAAANSRGGNVVVPDLEDTDKDKAFQTLGVSLATTYVLYEWDGWVGLNPDYAFSFAERTYYLYLAMEVGKMISPKSSAMLQLTQFVAGQPRLQTIFKARLNFFLR